MTASLRRQGATYAVLAAMVAKAYLAYNWSALIDIIKSLLSMVVLVYYWRAIYANTATIAGLTLETTLAYILLARIFLPLGGFDMVGEFSYQLEEGGITHLLLRPLNLQLAYFVEGQARLLVALARQLPVVLAALLFFRLRWPTEPAVWGVFICSALLGRVVLFCLDWILGCVAFYTTSAWGLQWAVHGLVLFFGGGLVPLAMLPDGLRLIAQNTPFAQGFYVPISLLSGLTPLSEAPRLLLIQLVWLAVMVPLSWLVFAVAIRRVTIQGG